MKKKSKISGLKTSVIHDSALPVKLELIKKSSKNTKVQVSLRDWKKIEKLFKDLRNKLYVKESLTRAFKQATTEKNLMTLNTALKSL